MASRDGQDDRRAALPAVHALARAAVDAGAAPEAATAAARAAIDAARVAIARAAPAEEIAALVVPAAVVARARPTLRRVINATGVVLHTGLGRAPLAPAALAAIAELAAGYCSLELDLATGERGSRHDHVTEALIALTGAEAALVVNNNAAATVLALAALAADREVVVSRGELVEIGGAFRVPEILALSRCRLVEVGTTNKTRVADYADAIGAATGLLLKVHRSNFAIIGFTEEVSATDLAALARARGLPSMLDLGSGALLDGATQAALGLPVEQSVADAVASGVDVVCFSGDKLLGGPQAGILVGRAELIARLRRHPLMRALRPDKLTLAALGATLALYRAGAWQQVPSLAALAQSMAALETRAAGLMAALPAGTVEAHASRATVGGGAMPTASVPSVALVLASADGATALHARLRAGAPAVVARIDDGRVWLDLRTVAPDEDAALGAALRAALDLR